MVCTFFGHRECCESIRYALKDSIIQLIENRGVLRFYVGNQGNFDNIVISVLAELKKDYRDINAEIILAYLRNDKFVYTLDTLFPESLETVPPRFAIDRRNLWMIENADVVVTYVRRNYGGAAKYKKIAKRKGREIVEI